MSIPVISMCNSLVVTLVLYLAFYPIFTVPNAVFCCTFFCNDCQKSFNKILIVLNNCLISFAVRYHFTPIQFKPIRSLYHCFVWISTVYLIYGCTLLILYNLKNTWISQFARPLASTDNNTKVALLRSLLILFAIYIENLLL